MHLPVSVNHFAAELSTENVTQLYSSYAHQLTTSFQNLKTHPITTELVALNKSFNQLSLLFSGALTSIIPSILP